ALWHAVLIWREPPRPFYVAYAVILSRRPLPFLLGARPGAGDQVSAVGKPAGEPENGAYRPSLSASCATVPSVQWRPTDPHAPPHPHRRQISAHRLRGGQGRLRRGGLPDRQRAGGGGAADRARAQPARPAGRSDRPRRDGLPAQGRAATVLPQDDA